MKILQKTALQRLAEKDLIERIKANDRTVLGEIFIRYERIVFSYVKTHGGDEADAEDILQESIIILWQNVCSGKFKLSAKLSTYIIGIAKNKWKEQLRKRKNILEMDGEKDFPDTDASSLEIILSKEKADRVHQALSAISPICKKLLMVFYFEERNLSEIAKILNLANTDVAKSKKYQCKKALEEELRKLKVI